MDNTNPIMKHAIMKMLYEMSKVLSQKNNDAGAGIIFNDVTGLTARNGLDISNKFMSSTLYTPRDESYKSGLSGFSKLYEHYINGKIDSVKEEDLYKTIIKIAKKANTWNGEELFDIDTFQTIKESSGLEELINYIVADEELKKQIYKRAFDKRKITVICIGDICMKSGGEVEGIKQACKMLNEYYSQVDLQCEWILSEDSADAFFANTNIPVNHSLFCFFICDETQEWEKKHFDIIRYRKLNHVVLESGRYPIAGNFEATSIRFDYKETISPYNTVDDAKVRVIMALLPILNTVQTVRTVLNSGDESQIQTLVKIASEEKMKVGKSYIKVKHNVANVRIATYQELCNLGMTPIDIANRLVENDCKLYDMEIDDENEGNPELWAQYLSSYPDTFRYLLNEDNEIVGNWSFLATSEEMSRKIDCGDWLESEFSIDATESILFPGDYYGYLLNFSINDYYNVFENYNLLINALSEQILKYAQKGIFFKSWHVNVFRTEHVAIYRRLGFSKQCKNKTKGIIYKLDMMNLQNNTSLITKDISDIYSNHFALVKTGTEEIPNTFSHQPATEKMETALDSPKQIAAIRAYSNAINDIDKLFLAPQLLNLKQYFYENNTELPGAEDIELGIALSLRIRDGLQYAQGLLPFIPQNYRESHIAYRQKIMNAEITKLALAAYTFDWENDEHDILKPTEVNVDSIVAYSKYWTDIGDVFIESREKARLRKYFFENNNELPSNKDEYEMAKIIAEMYRDAMMYSELLLDSVPFEFRRSYNKFKKHIMESKIIMASMENNKFRYEEELGF